MTQLPDSVRQRIEDEAKAYKQKGLVTSWRLNYIAGAVREAERGYKLAEAVRKYRDEPDYTDDKLFAELSAYMKSEG